MAEFAMIAATGLSAIGAIAQGNEANAAAKQNAALMEERGRQEREQQGFEAADQRRQSGFAMGRARSLLAAQGADLSFGSALEAQEDIASEGALRRDRTRLTGDRQFRARKFEASQERARGKAARNAGFFQAGSSILSGAAQYGSMYG